VRYGKADVLPVNANGFFAQTLFGQGRLDKLGTAFVHYDFFRSRI